ncbi:MAG TPA: transposase, partial [Clostridiales bacterium]|nr:transposase [Clostridiales bacterium]
EKGMEKGASNALVKTAIKLLTKKFGILPEEVISKISKLDNSILELIIEGIFEYKSIEDIKKYIG